MAKALQLINGVPRMAFVTGADTIYDETLVVGAGGITASTSVSLPSGGTYISKDLEIYLGGQFLEPVIDYTYVGVGTRTQVQFLEDLNESDRVRFRIEGDPDTIYDETVVVGAGGITTGTPITLPSGKSYFGDELEVFLNGQFLEPDIDFNIEGTGDSHTQISLTFDVNESERVRFRIDAM